MRAGYSTDELRDHEPSEWARLTQRIGRLGTSARGVFGFGHSFDGGWNLQQDVIELTSLVLALRKFKGDLGGDAFRYMEAGSGSGGTARVLAEEVGFTKMVSVDLPQTEFGRQKYEMFDAIGMTHIDAASDSLEAARFLIDMDTRFDVIFIDADHCERAVIQDILRFRNFASPAGAVMVFHDVIRVDAGFGVRPAIDLACRGGWLKPIAMYHGTTPELGIEICEVVR